MSNNKPKSAVTPINTFIQGKNKNPNDVVAAARAAQEAKDATKTATDKVEAPKAEDAPKEPEQAKEAATAEPEAKQPEAEEAKPEEGTKTKRKNKRLSRNEWVAIIKKYHESGKTAAEIAEAHSVSEGSVYKWASDLKKEEEEAAKAEEAAKLTPTSVVDDTKKLLEGVDGELEAFDAKIQAAKDLVASAAAERKKIEDSKAKYQQIIELLEGK